MKPMKILFIAPQPFYSERGTPMNVRLLCKVLGEAGNEIDLLVFPTGKDIPLKNVRIIRVPNIFMARHIPVGPSWTKLAFDSLITMYAILLVTSRKYDVIHGIEEGGFLAVVLGKLFGTASVFDMDSFISDQLEYSGFMTSPFLLKYVKLFEKWSFEHSSLVISVCQALSEKAKSLAPKSTIVQIEDIPIQDTNESQNERMDDLIKTYNLSNTRRVVYTGNLQLYQGIDLLLDAWKIFISQKEDNSKKGKLVIVGGPVDRVDYYRTVAAREGIENTVCWVGQRPSDEMGAWMNLSDVLVSPRSDGDNTPLKIYTYMSSGRPIVATRRRTHTQVLDDSMAFLAESEPLSFADAISAALNNNNLANEKSNFAKEIVDKNYSYNSFSKKLLEAYNSITH